MERCEIVKRAIEFRKPPRLPFWQSFIDDIPNDICDVWEMDRCIWGIVRQDRGQQGT